MTCAVGLGGGGGLPANPPCVTSSPSVFFLTGPWTVTRSFFTARCSADLLAKVRQATVLTPPSPFLFLHRRRVVVVKTCGVALPSAP